MKLEIITPECVYFSGEVHLVSFPGASGRFEIMENHAPLISLLKKGTLKYVIDDKNSQQMDVDGGFVELKNNQIVVCTELLNVAG
ncbi:MAG: hypothetical protein PHH37_04930 [Paludibacter sp.]|nr:hypothetical protein [Paludibacter sp.]